MTWTKLDDGFSDHPKILAVGPVGELLQVRALVWSNRFLTDGHVPDHVLPHITRGLAAVVGEATVTTTVGEMYDAGIWQRNGSGFVIHDFDEYQETKAKVVARRKDNRKRQRVYRHKKTPGLGPESRGVSNDTVTHPSQEGHASVTPLVTREKSTPVPSRTRPVPVTSESSNELSRPPLRGDVETLCQEMQASEVRKGHVKPLITQRWREDARLMFDRDKRVLKEALEVIRWVEADTFWRGVVRAVPSLRKHYDALRDKMKKPADDNPFRRFANS